MRIRRTVRLVTTMRTTRTVGTNQDLINGWLASLTFRATAFTDRKLISRISNNTRRTLRMVEFVALAKVRYPGQQQPVCLFA